MWNLEFKQFARRKYIEILTPKVISVGCQENKPVNRYKLNYKH